MKFTGNNHYHEQIKRLRVRQNWNRDKGAGYENKFKSTSIGFAAMSNSE